MYCCFTELDCDNGRTQDKILSKLKNNHSKSPISDQMLMYFSSTFSILIISTGYIRTCTVRTCGHFSNITGVLNESLREAD